MKKGKTAYSILELAMVSEGQTMQQTLHNTADVAKEGERSGYERIWFAEHHNAPNIGSSATSLLIGYAAENTKTIRVGSGGVMLPNHSPLIIAEQFGTLAHLYPGRIDLGLGRAPGTDQLTAQAIKSDFFHATHQFPNEVEAIQRYFSAENSTGAVRAPIAEGVEVPIFILGSSTDSAHLAAKMGLPYAFASHFATTHLFDALSIYHREFQPSQYLAEPYTIAGVNVMMADTDAEAEKLFTSMVRMFIGVLTRDNKPLQPPTEMTADLRQALEHPTLHQMLKYSFVGGKEKVEKEIRDFIDRTQVNELITVSSMYDHNDRVKSIRLFAELMEKINEGKKEEVRAS